MPSCFLQSSAILCFVSPSEPISSPVLPRLQVDWGEMGRKFKMADSESDEDNDWKKGEKRRQDSSNEDSDEDSYSEDGADTSDESFDENMVCLYSCFNHQLSCLELSLTRTSR